jgi:hypothetical protein
MSIWVPFVLLVMPTSIDIASLFVPSFIIVAMAMVSFVGIYVTRPSALARQEPDCAEQQDSKIRSRGAWAPELCHLLAKPRVIARSEATKQSRTALQNWIASLRSQ